MLSRRPFKSIKDLHAERLECLSVMWHHKLAAAAALHYCLINRLTIPTWVGEGALSTLCSLLRKDKSGTQGRASGIVARYRQDQIDYARWSEIESIRENQELLKDDIAELRSRSRVPRPLLQEREKLLDWAGNDLLRAYDCASMILRGTDAQGGPDAMKASYLRVKKNSRDKRLRYHLLDTNFLRLVGAEINLVPPKGRKVVALYDLTL